MLTNSREPTGQNLIIHHNEVLPPHPDHRKCIARFRTLPPDDSLSGALINWSMEQNKKHSFLDLGQLQPEICGRASEPRPTTLKEQWEIPSTTRYRPMASKLGTYQSDVARTCPPRRCGCGPYRHQLMMDSPNPRRCGGVPPAEMRTSARLTCKPRPRGDESWSTTRERYSRNKPRRRGGDPPVRS